MGYRKHDKKSYVTSSDYAENGKHVEGNTCCSKELACLQTDVISKSVVVNMCTANMRIEHDYVSAWRLRIGKVYFIKYSFKLSQYINT